MIAALINVLTILIGSAIGLVFKKYINETVAKALISSIGLCVLVIGLKNALRSEDILSILICTALGTFIGELLNIESRVDKLGEFLKRKFVKKGEESVRFTDAFVTTSVLYCIGAMPLMGSIEAGIYGNYSILISKSILDGVSSVTFAAAMGIGVAFSAIPILVYEGGITLLAGWIAPYMSEVIITEMSAVGGVITMASAISMIIPGARLKAANMMPAMFLPFAYLPVVNYLSGLV